EIMRVPFLSSSSLTFMRTSQARFAFLGRTAYVLPLEYCGIQNTKCQFERMKKFGWVAANSTVIARLGRAIHERYKNVNSLLDGRVKPGHDNRSGIYCFASCFTGDWDAQDRTVLHRLLGRASELA